MKRSILASNFSQDFRRRSIRNILTEKNWSPFIGDGHVFIQRRAEKWERKIGISGRIEIKQSVSVAQNDQKIHQRTKVVVDIHRHTNKTGKHTPRK